MSRRIDFNDLFEFNDKNVLALKRKTNNQWNSI